MAPWACGSMTPVVFHSRECNRGSVGASSGSAHLEDGVAGALVGVGGVVEVGGEGGVGGGHGGAPDEGGPRLGGPTARGGPAPRRGGPAARGAADVRADLTAAVEGQRVRLQPARLRQQNTSGTALRKSPAATKSLSAHTHGRGGRPFCWRQTGGTTRPSSVLRKCYQTIMPCIRPSAYFNASNSL